MTIFWTFFNKGNNGDYFEVKLQSSVPDHMFEFSLAVADKGSSSWVILPSYASGNEVHNLKIQGSHGQNLFLLIKDKNGIEKKIKYPSDVFWVGGGDIGSFHKIVDYKKFFEDSLDMSEEEMNCEALFLEYKRLDASTHIEAQVGGHGKAYHVNQIKPQELILKKVIAKELANKYEKYFKDKPAEWHEIQQDVL